MKNILFLLGLVLSTLSGAAYSAGDSQVATQVYAGPAPDGRDFLVALELSPNQGWHTYWDNPGDAGLGTRIRWTLPQGVEAGPILWPAPKAYLEGDLQTYGYGEPHTLLTRLSVAQDTPDDALISLKARWLVCKDICIPESADHQLTVKQLRDSGMSDLLARALQALPETLHSEAHYSIENGMVRSLIPLPADALIGASNPHWFPAQAKFIAHAGQVTWQRGDAGIVVSNPQHPDFRTPEAPIRGVLTVDLEGKRHAIEVSMTPGTVPKDLTDWSAAPKAATTPLWTILLMAFAGGLILNLMPCVFPVLTLKAMNLARAESLADKRLESIAYTLGVVLSFLFIAALLLALRAGGAALGWGFQLQNPVVVSLLAALMFVLGLAMLGWSQLGMGLMGTGQSLTQQSGSRGAFFTGVLAVVVASPCTAPFMGGALGYAVLQPAPVALGIFAALGLGLAAPFALLPWVPALAHRLPKPGPWMETLKHWMALPLLLTAVWLYWVLWRQAGTPGLLLGVLAASALAFGLRQKPGENRGAVKRAATLVGVILAITPMWAPAPQAREVIGDWSVWSPQAVASAQSEGRMVFVDFTADWCLSCLANERAVLASDDVQTLFEKHNTLLLKADWTQYDPTITAALAEFGRNGVPLYLVYPPNGGKAEVLPQLLTRSVVRNALDRAAQAAP